MRTALTRLTRPIIIHLRFASSRMTHGLMKFLTVVQNASLLRISLRTEAPRAPSLVTRGCPSEKVDLAAPLLWRPEVVITKVRIDYDDDVHQD